MRTSELGRVEQLLVKLPDDQELLLIWQGSNKLCIVNNNMGTISTRLGGQRDTIYLTLSPPCPHESISVTTIQAATESYLPLEHGYGSDESPRIDQRALVSAFCDNCGKDMIEWARAEFPTLPLRREES